ncbi:ComEC/Rec2 family competence protein [Thermomonas sp. S9]|nr:ComEC/Rec2 family competence protein [Thermomonas sp. S9]
MADTLALGIWVLLALDPLAVLGAGFWLSFAGVA